MSRPVSTRRRWRWIMDKCCVTKCKNKATVALSNNLIDGEILFCKNCHKLFELHEKARRNMFFKQGADSVQEASS